MSFRHPCFESPSESIEFTAAACQLAQEIFMARKAAYGITEQWGTLTPAIRQIYVRHAADILKAHAPASSKVAGTIAPEFPWGISHDDRTR